MALTTDSNRVVATGDNSTTRFYFNRLLYDATHLEVYLDDALQVAGYTVGGIVDPWTANHVDFSVAPGTGVQVLLLRVVPLTQLSVYGVAGAFPAKTTEKNLDLAMMALQQFDERLDRAITLPVESTLTAADIPDPADPLNYGLGLKIATDGSGLDTFSLSATPFTSPLTTKGDLAVFSTIADRLAVGANGSFLIGASGQARGVKYFAPGTNGYVLQSDSAQTDKLAWVAPNQPANPTINGNMEIWQRGTSFAAPTTGSYAADRFRFDFVGAGVVTISRSTNVPTVAEAGILFNYSLDIDVTTADAAIVAADTYTLQHRIEGYNWRHFAQRGCTVSFWVRDTVTGEHAISFRNSGNDRSYVATYTVNTTDTWEYKTVTVSASPSAGTWNYTNGIGINISFDLAPGSTFHTTAGAWQVGNFTGTATTVNSMSSTANFFRITGIKMELGSVATPIQFVPFEEELARAQRYYAKSFRTDTTPAQNAGSQRGEVTYTSVVAGTGTQLWGVRRPVRMRTPTPTTTLYNPVAANAQAYNGTDAVDCTASQANTNSEDAFTIQANGNAANSVGDLWIVHWASDAEL